VEAIRGRDDPAIGRRVVDEVADVVGRFPVPGLPVR
jgi:hypothetical protein